MTANEFREILDRFDVALIESGHWKVMERRPLDDDTPEWALELHSIWYDLNRECALMKDAEQQDAERIRPLRVFYQPLQTAVRPTRSLPLPPLNETMTHGKPLPYPLPL